MNTAHLGVNLLGLILTVIYVIDLLLKLMCFT